MYIFHCSDKELLSNFRRKNFLKEGLFSKFLDVAFESFLDMYNYLIQDKLILENECLNMFISSNILNDEKETLIKIEEFIKDNKNYSICFFINEENIKLDISISSLFQSINKLEKFNDKNKEILIKELLKEKEIDCNKQILIDLNNLLPNDENIIRNEINKLINKTSINLDLINDYSEFNMFKIIDNWFQNKHNEVIHLLESSFKTTDQSIFLLNFIIKRFSEFYFCKKLVNLGYSLQEVAGQLKCNFFVLKNDWEKISLLSIKTIEKILYNLYNVEKYSRLYQSDVKNQLKQLFLLEDLNGK